MVGDGRSDLACLFSLGLVIPHSKLFNLLESDVVKKIDDSLLN